MDWRSRHRRDLFSDKNRLGEILRRVGAIASRGPDSSEYVLTNKLPRLKEYSDGTPHFSLLGHQAILREILRVLVVVSKDGRSRETLADMLNRINEEELSSREKHSQKLHKGSVADTSVNQLGESSRRQ